MHSESVDRKISRRIGEFSIRNRSENTIVVRLSKSDARVPFFDSVEFHRSEQQLIERNRFKADKKQDEENESKPQESKPDSEEVKEAPSRFYTTLFEFSSAMYEFMSGAEFIREEMGVSLAALFSITAQNFLEKNGVKIGNSRTSYRWYVLSDKKLSELTAQLDRRVEKTSFVGNAPKMLLPALVSQFDAFILRTLNDILETKPEIANSIQRTISMAELLEFSSIEAARGAIIDKEIDNVLRDSHDKHLAWIANKVGIKIEPDPTLSEKFFELCERRNCIIHNDSRVNTTYLSKCEKYGVDVSGLADGDNLVTDVSYFSRSISCLLEMAAKINQAVWRKLEPGQLEEADTAINELTYELLQRRRYKLALRLFEFCRNDIKNWGTEYARLQNMINHANAYRLSDEKDKATSLLDKEDWTSRSAEFQLCEAAIRDDVDRCIELLELHGKAMKISRIDYVEWPVFERLRSEERFLNAFEKVFGESFIDELLDEADSKSV